VDLFASNHVRPPLYSLEDLLQGSSPASALEAQGDALAGSRSAVPSTLTITVSPKYSRLPSDGCVTLVRQGRAPEKNFGDQGRSISSRSTSAEVDDGLEIFCLRPPDRARVAKICSRTLPCSPLPSRTARRERRRCFAGAFEARSTFDSELFSGPLKLVPDSCRRRMSTSGRGPKDAAPQAEVRG